MNIIEILEKEQLRSDIPAFGPGDTVWASSVSSLCIPRVLQRSR